MCGIFGFVGRSLDPKATFALANALFVKTEIRGEHASGFWACEPGDGSVFYDKEAIKSSIYVHRDIWSRDFAATNTDLLLAHCRLSSAGVGHEKFNKNNHPHVSDDRRLALIHNGRILEFSSLRSKYDTLSDCDSEVLLRILESAESYKGKDDYLKQEFPSLAPELAYRLLGLKEIYARVNYGAMAVAVGERGEDGSRYLWLFRDSDRPIHVVDLRATLGQIFFCSTPEIWKQAVEACPIIREKKYVASSDEVIEFPADQIWLLATAAPNQDWILKKFKITKTNFYSSEEESKEPKFARKKGAKPTFKVVSRLGSDGEVEKDKESKSQPAQKKVTVSTTEPEPDTIESVQAADIITPPIEGGEIDMEKFNDLVKEMQQSLDDIRTEMENLSKERSLDPKQFEDVMGSLGDAKDELQATLIFLRPS